MCTLICKYFPNVGWVGVKNRDRNYVAEVDFVRNKADGIERLLMEDEISGYMEGLNDNGISILTTSLMVIDDEKEVKGVPKKKTGKSRDGQRIKNGLKYGNIDDVVENVIESKLSGCIAVFNAENMYIIESAYKGPDKTDWHYAVEKIAHDQTVARTNHGIFLPWAGYQRTPNSDKQTASRISSEARHMIAEFVVNDAKHPMDMMDNLCQKFTDEPQLNSMRIETSAKKMRTVGQIMLKPNELVMYYRPIASKMNFDFWELNRPDSVTWVEILSPRPLWQKSEWKAMSPEK